MANQHSAALCGAVIKKKTGIGRWVSRPVDVQISKPPRKRRPSPFFDFEHFVKYHTKETLRILEHFTKQNTKDMLRDFEHITKQNTKETLRSH